MIDPNHLLISSIEPSNAGYAALEVVFHEASHTVFGPGLEGRLWTELEAAAKADGAPLAPNFWHAMLFYTTGSTVKARLAERGIDYEQDLYTEGLFERSWPGFRQPLERLWQQHLDGRVSRMEALKLIVAAHKLPDRGETLVAASLYVRVLQRPRHESPRLPPLERALARTGGTQAGLRRRFATRAASGFRARARSLHEDVRERRRRARLALDALASREARRNRACR